MLETCAELVVIVYFIIELCSSYKSYKGDASRSNLGKSYLIDLIIAGVVLAYLALFVFCATAVALRRSLILLGGAVLLLRSSYESYKEDASKLNLLELVGMAVVVVCAAFLVVAHTYDMVCR